MCFAQLDQIQIQQSCVVIFILNIPGVTVHHAIFLSAQVTKYASPLAAPRGQHIHFSVRPKRHSSASQLACFTLSIFPVLETCNSYACVDLPTCAWPQSLSQQWGASTVFLWQMLTCLHKQLSKEIRLDTCIRVSVVVCFG